MRFDHDAFISYAHLDNLPMTPGERGWVSQFHATLRTLLIQYLGEEARIWRDEKLAGNDEFNDEIRNRIEHAAVLVTVLTPRYQRSSYCARELTDFCAAALSTGGVSVGNMSRIFKVVKAPMDPEPALPEIVSGTLGFPFFTEQSGVPMVLDPAFGDRARQEFLQRVNSLAFALTNTLKALRVAAGTVDPGVAEATADAQPAPGTRTAGLAALSAAATTDARPAVYLAECGHDLRDAREQLAAALRREGHPVVEVGDQRWTDADLPPAVDAALARCALSIHFVGSGVGPIPDGPSGRSQAIVENERAALRCRQGGLRRVIWLPDGVVGQRPEQQTFIDTVLGKAEAQFGADILRDSLEALKSAVLDGLSKQMAAAQASVRRAVTAGPADDRPRTVHVIMAEADADACAPLLQWLTARGIEWSQPVFKGEAAELRRINGELLAGADAAVLLYGHGDVLWRQHQSNDLRKQIALGGRRVPVLTCLVPPLTDDKTMRRKVGGAQMIDAIDGVTDDGLQPLLAAFDEAAAGVVA